MGRTPQFRDLARTIRMALAFEREGISTREGMERVAEAEARAVRRREFLKGALGVGAAGAVMAAGPMGSLFAQDGGPSIAVVGAGLAGLVCADTLKQQGIRATLYESGFRAGGRCFSMRGFFPGQVVERGGELVDNLHKTMLGYAQRFNLAKEDITKFPGEVFYYFGGQRYPESVVVDEYRAFVPRMRDDLRTLSGGPTADLHNDADVKLDNTNLLQYLETRGAGTVAKAAIANCYMAEYGLAPDQQSCLNFLLFIHADRRSKFTPWGVFSDERWHLTDGNDGVAQGIAGVLQGQLQYGTHLIRVRKLSDGRIELTFKIAGTTAVRVHDAVVLTLPFSVLRGVELHASLGLPAWKTQAINELGYGTNAKMMVGFGGKPWEALGSNGSSYSDLANHQATWETNPSRATATRAVLTDYASAQRGATLDPTRVQTEVTKFLGDLNKVYPGSAAAATRDSKGKYLAHLEHWPSNPLSKGSYTGYKPGQFTTIAGNEGKPVGNLYFAGEHADSFYSWQGFMEGACLSGIAAASRILQDLKAK